MATEHLNGNRPVLGCAPSINRPPEVGDSGKIEASAVERENSQQTWETAAAKKSQCLCDELPKKEERATEWQLRETAIHDRLSEYKRKLKPAW